MLDVFRLYVSGVLCFRLSAVVSALVPSLSMSDNSSPPLPRNAAVRTWVLYKRQSLHEFAERCCLDLRNAVDHLARKHNVAVLRYADGEME